MFRKDSRRPENIPQSEAVLVGRNTMTMLTLFLSEAVLVGP